MDEITKLVNNSADAFRAESGRGKAERMLAWLAIGYGAAIANPFTNVFREFYTFTLMMRILDSEAVWGLAIMTVGIFQLIMWRRRLHKGRKIACLIGCAMWASLSALFVAGSLYYIHPPSLLTAVTLPGVVLFSICAVFEIDVFKEIGQRAEMPDSLKERLSQIQQ